MNSSDFQKIVIFDIDGTLADCSERVHHLEKSPKDWESFFDGMESDRSNHPVVEICNAMAKTGHYVLLCTGRYERHRKITENWLSDNSISYNELRMRPDDDKRPDTEIKREMISDEELKKLLFVVEDRERVVDMWRNLGITCLQCDSGNF